MSGSKAFWRKFKRAKPLKLPASSQIRRRTRPSRCLTAGKMEEWSRPGMVDDHPCCRTAAGIWWLAVLACWITPVLRPVSRQSIGSPCRLPNRTYTNDSGRNNAERDEKPFGSGVKLGQVKIYWPGEDDRKGDSGIVWCVLIVLKNIYRSWKIKTPKVFSFGRSNSHGSGSRDDHVRLQVIMN